MDDDDNNNVITIGNCVKQTTQVIKSLFTSKDLYKQACTQTHAS